MRPKRTVPFWVRRCNLTYLITFVFSMIVINFVWMRKVCFENAESMPCHHSADEGNVHVLAQAQVEKELSAALEEVKSLRKSVGIAQVTLHQHRIPAGFKVANPNHTATCFCICSILTKDRINDLIRFVSYIFWIYSLPFIFLFAARLLNIVLRARLRVFFCTARR